MNHNQCNTQSNYTVCITAVSYTHLDVYKRQTLDHLASEGFDFRKHMVEFDCKDGGNIGGGIDISVDAQCTVDGLFAAGDETGNFRADMGGAATYGHIAGVSAACYSRGQTLIPAEEMEIVTARAHHYSEIISRDTDTATPDWREINVAIQQVMTDYCGPEVRSEHILTTGLSHLKRLQAKAATVHCADSHEFMRCLEAEDLALLGELAFVSALERKETRGKHNRVDYPFTNPLLNNKFVTVEKVNGVPVSYTHLDVYKRQPLDYRIISLIDRRNHIHSQTWYGENRLRHNNSPHQPAESSSRRCNHRNQSISQRMDIGNLKL